MKKFITVFIIALTFLVVPVHAEESCTYKEEAELREKASNIRADYEVKEEEIGGEEDSAPILVYYFTISVMNITDEFYVEVTNDFNSEKKIIGSQDIVDGIATFDWDVSSEVTDFTFKVYSVAVSNCSGVTLKTFHLQTPRYNENYHICADEFPDYYLCQKFVTFKKMDRNEFYKSLNSYRNRMEKENEKNNKDNFFDKIFNFINKNKFIIIGVILVAGAGSGTYIYIKRKKQRDLGL